MGIFQPDDIALSDVEKLVDAFPGQSIDFFGALRARIYDDKVREFVIAHGIENLGKQLVNRRDGKVQMEKPFINVKSLIVWKCTRTRARKCKACPTCRFVSQGVRISRHDRV